MQSLAKQRVVGHPNKLIGKFDQLLADKNLAIKLKNAKSSLPCINQGFQKRLDDRRKKLMNSSSGIQVQDLSIINPDIPENYRHQTSIPKERDGSCVKVIKSAKRLGSMERETPEPVMKLRQKGDVNFPNAWKHNLGVGKLGGDFDVLDWLNRDQVVSRGSKLPSAGELKDHGKESMNHFPRRHGLPPLPVKDHILSGSQHVESNLPPLASTKRSEAVKTPEVHNLRFSLDGRLAAKAPSRRYCGDVSTDHGDHEESNNEIFRNPGCRVAAVLETVEDDSPVLPARSRMSLMASDFKMVAREIENLEDEFPANQTVQAEEDDEVNLY